VALNSNDWTSQIASALCAASRWLSAASLVLMLFAFNIAAIEPRAGAHALAVFAFVVVLGLAQIYLAVRIEFDRVIFEVATGRPDGFAGFDGALAKLGWKRSSDSERSPAQRAVGLMSLVKWSGWLLGIQFALVLTALWLLQ
jgi:hypothetical protein